MHVILDHIVGVVRPALRKYLAAEKALTAALESKDAGAVSTACQRGHTVRRLDSERFVPVAVIIEDFPAQ